jgi:hypothetical protein
MSGQEVKETMVMPQAKLYFLKYNLRNCKSIIHVMHPSPISNSFRLVYYNHILPSPSLSFNYFEANLECHIISALNTRSSEIVSHLLVPCPLPEISTPCPLFGWLLPVFQMSSLQKDLPWPPYLK